MTTLNDHVRVYLAQPGKRAPSTMYRISGSWNTLTLFLGRPPMPEDMTVDTFHDWLAWRAATVSPATVNTSATHVRALWAWLEQRGVVDYPKAEVKRIHKAYLDQQAAKPRQGLFARLLSKGRAER